VSLALIWRFLHLFFAFAFVGTLVLAEWNSRSARLARDWNLRAVLFYIVHRACGIAGLGALLMLGAFGNLHATSLGYSMRADTWMRWVNALWLAAVLVQGFLVLPVSKRLAALAKSAADGGAGDGWDALLGRWRLANMLQSALYVTLLALMVFRWRH
jgi:hypothetical protein